VILPLPFVVSEYTQTIPGSETVLDELMYRPRGDLLTEGVNAKFADDLHFEGGTIEELAASFLTHTTAPG